MTESYCYTADTNIENQLYFNFKKDYHEKPKLRSVTKMVENLKLTALCTLKKQWAKDKFMYPIISSFWQEGSLCRRPLLFCH